MCDGTCRTTSSSRAASGRPMIRAHFASTTKAIATTARPRTTGGRAMRADETIGVAAAARLLRCLCETREATVAEQAKALGVRRSTAFVVAAGLEATGLAERDSRGRLRAGPAATRLG